MLCSVALLRLFAGGRTAAARARVDSRERRTGAAAGIQPLLAGTDRGVAVVADAQPATGGDSPAVMVSVQYL